eukprot:gene7549-8828_t
MFGKGLQTWEYSPVYALRSYAYLWIHAAFGHLTAIVGAADNKVTQFYLIKTFIGMLTAYGQSVFYAGVKKRFGNIIALYTAVFMLLSPGFFLATSTYLPTTFSMMTVMLAYGCWMLDRPLLSVFMCATSVFMGWPFVIVIAAPLALDLLVQHGLLRVISYALLPVIGIFVPMCLIDHYFYGKWVVAIFNIIAYNFTSNHAGGSQLYGVEEWTFYFLNCIVNFNVVFVASMAALPAHSNPIQLAFTFTLPPQRRTFGNTFGAFLFVIYPFFCLCAAISIYLVSFAIKCMVRPTSAKKAEDSVPVISTFGSIVLSLLKLAQATFVILFIALSVSRITATYINYNAPYDVYNHLATKVLCNGDTHHDDFPQSIPVGAHVRVCVAKEWHRFPSHFFIPTDRLDKRSRKSTPKNITFELSFIQSSFSGHLPKLFSAPYPTGTRAIPSNMNDRNQQEMDRYVDIDSCTYLVDFETPSQAEERYTLRENFRSIYSHPFLDAGASSSLARAFYIPSYSFAHSTFHPYHLLENKAKLKDLSTTKISIDKW